MAAYLSSARLVGRKTAIQVEDSNRWAFLKELVEKEGGVVVDKAVADVMILSDDDEIPDLEKEGLIMIIVKDTDFTLHALFLDEEEEIRKKQMSQVLNRMFVGRRKQTVSDDMHKWLIRNPPKRSTKPVVSMAVSSKRKFGSHLPFADAGKIIAVPLKTCDLNGTRIEDKFERFRRIAAKKEKDEVEPQDEVIPKLYSTTARSVRAKQASEMGRKRGCRGSFYAERLLS